MIGWFGDGADNASPEGAEFCLHAALDRNKERLQRTAAASVQPRCVPVCSGSIPVQADWVQFPGGAIQFVVQDRLSAILAPESFPGCC